MNEHSHERAQDFLEERIANGGFRCDRCAMVWPLPWNEQDGFYLCDRDFDSMGRIEAQQNIADSQARGGINPITPLPIPPIGALDGMATVTGISPLALSLTRGGAAGTLTITGVGLTSADTWAATNPTHISVTPTVISSTSVTLSITADGTTARADYNVTFNGDTLLPRGILKVR